MQLISGIIRLIFRLLAFVGIAAVVFVFLLLDFMSRSNPNEGKIELPRTAIVFTGHFDRIHLGLDLLATDRVGRLFITGVNGDAGLNVARFASQFELTAEQAGWIVNEKIILSPDAHSTFENALETACWLDLQPDVKAVVLVTSRRHMARASVALQHGISPISVVRVTSDPVAEYDTFQLDMVEFSRFVATWFITLFPRDFWPGNAPELCRAR